MNIIWGHAIKAIQEMRNAGMGEISIACVVQDLHAAFVLGERIRVLAVLNANPPHFPTTFEIADLIKDNVASD